MFDAVAALLAAIGHQKAGRLHAAESLLRDVLTHDPDEPNALFLLGSTLQAMGRSKDAIAPLREAVLLRPDHREQRQALARALLTGTRPAEALAVLAPLAGNRRLAEVQFLRGTALNAMGCPQDAAIALFDAIAAAPLHAEAHLNLGNALADLGDIAAAEARMRHALTLEPNLAAAHASLGFLLTGRGDLPGAITACQHAVDLQPDFAAAHWNQGIAFLLAGRMAEGWAQYEWRKQHFPSAFHIPAGLEWDGGPLDGRTLLVLAEQGFGDTIQLCRYLPPLVAAGARVVLECARPLMALLACLEGVSLIATRTRRPAYDVWADQMSLPRLLGTTLDTVPSPGAYLQADPARMSGWPQGCDGSETNGLRIGIAWAGNPAHSNDRNRSMPIEALAPILSAPCIFVSLQVGAAAMDAPGLGLATTILTDFADTAARSAQLDLVITVDTAVAHLAGALGIPTWVMLPYAPDWRWMLHRTDSPWYASMRLFRQNQPGDWTGMAVQIADALRAAAYSIAIPPLTCSVAPVTHPASAEAK